MNFQPPAPPQAIDYEMAWRGANHDIDYQSRLIVTLESALRYAAEWIGAVPHGDNCFVSNHYAGDPGNQCNCGKDSVLDVMNKALPDSEEA